MGLLAYTNENTRPQPAGSVSVPHLLAGRPNVYAFAVLILSLVVVVAQREVRSAAVFQGVCCDLRPLDKVLQANAFSPVRVVVVS